MARRYYRNGPATTLSASCGAADTSIQVTSASGFPTLFPYTLILDKDEGTEEVVEVSAAAGTTLTVTRGVDSTTGFPHNSGAVVVHGISARDADEANLHVNSVAAVHGVTGALVGTTDAQTLTNKTLSSATINSSTLSSPAISGGTIAGTTIRDTTLVQGNPANSQKPISLRDTASVEVGYFDRDGHLQVPRLDAISVDIASTPLLVKGMTGQTGDLARIRTVADAPGIEVSASGRIGLGRSPGSATTVLVRSVAVGDPALRIQRLASQTGALLDAVDESGSTMLFRFDKDGYRVSPNWILASLSANRQKLDTDPRYRRVDGYVELGGSVGPNPSGAMDATAGYTLFTLPVGFRPAQIQRIACAVSLTGDPNSASDRVDVNTDGTVNLFSQQNPHWAILDGIRFPLD